MTIQVGDRLPDVPLTIAGADGPQPTTTGEFFGGKRVALFAVPGAAVVTVDAVLKEASSVSVPLVAVHIVESDHLTFPDVAEVVHTIFTLSVPDQSAGSRNPFCAEKPPEVSAKSNTPFCVLVPVTQAATAGVAVGRSQKDDAVALLQPAAVSQLFNAAAVVDAESVVPLILRPLPIVIS